MRRIPWQVEACVFLLILVVSEGTSRYRFAAALT